MDGIQAPQAILMMLKCEPLTLALPIVDEDFLRPLSLVTRDRHLYEMGKDSGQVKIQMIKTTIILIPRDQVI